MHTQRFRLTSTGLEVVVEVRSTADGKHYCNVRDIKSALDFDIMAKYKVDGDPVEYLPEDDGTQASTRLKHAPGKVIEVTLCDLASPNTLKIMRSRPSSQRSAPVIAVTTGQISGNAQHTVVVPSPEGVESFTNQSRDDEPHIAMPSYFPYKESHDNLDDNEKKQHIVVQDPSQREEIGRALEPKEKDRTQEPSKPLCPRDELSRVTSADSLSIRNQAKTICTHSYELYEHPCPHLFVTLPEFKGDPARDSYQLKDLSENKFRLHFICEGGIPRRSEKRGEILSDHPEDQVHLAFHEGYELLRPSEFHEKFGHYILGMLQFMKECQSTGNNLVKLGGSLTTTAERELLQEVLSVEKRIKVGPSVDMITNYVQNKLNSKHTLDGGKDSHITSSYVTALNGAELRHLETFLLKEDHERVLGNLWRVVTPEGRVRWVCKHHFDEAHRHEASEKFLQLVITNNSGFFQENLSRLTLSFKAPKIAVRIVGALATLSSISELNMTLAWNFSAAELDSVVTKFNQTSVQLLTLDLDDKGGFFKRPRGRLLSSCKYQSLQKLYRNQRLRSFRLFGASRFGTRTEPLLGDIVPNLQTLHFRIRFDCYEDQTVLQSIIQRCPQLVDLQLGGTYKSEIHEALAETIGGLKRLEIFHLYGMEQSGDGGIIYNLLSRLLKSGCPLRELVLVNSQVDAIETMGLIKSCERTLEVLVLDLAVFQPLKLTSIFPEHCGCSLDSYQLLRNLTSLHFHVADDPPSVQQLAKVIQGLSLTHLGLSQRDPQAVKKSLDSKSLLHHVNFGSLQSLFLSGFSGSCLDPLWESVNESEFSASAHRPLKSLSLEFLSDCPDLANKLNRLALKSLWVVAEVDELGCEINQLALDLDLSTFKNVALFKTKYPAFRYTYSLTDVSVKSYFEDLRQNLGSGEAQGLTMRVGEMIGGSDRTDLNGLSGLMYSVDERSTEEVIEVRSTDDGDHYCHVRDIQHALDFDTLATYTVDGVSIACLEDGDGRPGTTRLKHFPDKVIEVTPREPEEITISDILPRPLASSYHSVTAARSFQDTIMMENVEVVQCPANSSREEQPIVVQNYIQQDERHKRPQEQREGISGGPQQVDKRNKALQVELQIIRKEVKNIWLQDYELYECTIPRLFVILPERKDQGTNSGGSTKLSQDKFRLHFICEGGFRCQANMDGTKSGSEDPEDHVHLALHEGYELSRLDEFLAKFGRYTLGMLRFMKECVSTSDTFMESNSLNDGNNRISHEAKDATNMITSGLFMDIAINYLESIQNTLEADTDGHDELHRFHSLSGNDLKHLETLLHTKDLDSFGNLSRVITPEGRIKWVCMHHSDEAYLPVARQNLLQLVTTTNSGFFQQNLRHLTLSLKDPKLATVIIGELPNFSLLSELSLELDWDFNTADLDWIVKKLNGSSVVHLNLDLKDKAFFKPPKTRLLSTRKYQPLQQLYQNENLRSFRLVGASRFGIRTSRLTGVPDSNLRKLHFRIRFDCKEDQEVLQSIIRKCPHLVDLRLGGTYKSVIHDTLAETIGRLKKLEVLHLYGMERSRSGGVIYNLLKRLQESGCALRELVLVNSKMDALETMHLIKSCERTLEVLVLDLADFQPLKLTSILPDLNGPVLDDYQLLRNLTSLHFHVAEEPQSVRRLSNTLERLSLTHLGLSQRNPEGIKNSLEGKSLLHYVNFESLRSLFLSGFSGSCLDPLWESAKAPQSSAAAAYRPLESLSLEFLSDCPDLAEKLNQLALKSLWVIAEVDQLGCEVNQLAFDLDLSTLSNVALFRTKRITYWCGSILTERPLSKLDVGKYYDGLEKFLALKTDQDLTLRVGEMIASNSQLDFSILSVLTYRVQHVDGQKRVTPRASYVWRQHNPRYHRYRWGWSSFA
ncbi:hypothetical protein EC968_003234 [Mortierella alpina]|nr:hypothetical protein EC968_003234 [Mortierella alpina]